jgi:hypothetical protein
MSSVSRADLDLDVAAGLLDRLCVRLLERQAGVPKLALGPMEAAAALSMSHDYFNEHVAPDLRWVVRGRKRLVAVAELERWLDRNAARVFEEIR